MCDEARELVSAGPGDAELAHARLERGPLEAENLGGPALTAHAPADAFEHRQDVAALDLVERARSLRPGLSGSGGRRRQGALDVQPVRPAEDDRALDDVLELADVAGPVIAREPGERA